MSLNQGVGVNWFVLKASQCEIASNLGFRFIDNGGIVVGTINGSWVDTPKPPNFTSGTTVVRYTISCSGKGGGATTFRDVIITAP